MSVEVHLTATVDLSYWQTDGGWHILDYGHGWISDEVWPSAVEASAAFEAGEVGWAPI